MLVKIENQSLKLGRIGRIRTFLFLMMPFTISVTYDPVKTRLSELEVEVEEPTYHKAQNQALQLACSSASVPLFPSPKI